MKTGCLRKYLISSSRLPLSLRCHMLPICREDKRRTRDSGLVCCAKEDEGENAVGGQCHRHMQNQSNVLPSCMRISNFAITPSPTSFTRKPAENPSQRVAGSKKCDFACRSSTRYGLYSPNKDLEMIRSFCPKGSSDEWLD